MAENDQVFYELPDGTQVSNDPAWAQDNLSAALEASLESRPNSGNMGIPDDEQAAQTGQGEHPLQAGVDGDFDPTGGVTAASVQLADAQAAEDAGYTPTEPKVQVENPDSNERVQEVRLAKAEAALEEAGEEAGDPETPYTEWSAKQLKAELAARNAARSDDDQIDTAGVKTKAQLAEVLERDDNG